MNKSHPGRKYLFYVYGWDLCIVGSPLLIWWI